MKQVHSVYTCDLCQDDRDGATPAQVVPSLQGTKYTLDLCDKHAERLQQSLAQVEALLSPYIQAGRPLRAAKTGKKVTPQVEHSYNQRAVREWARARGYTVAERGQLPRHVVRAYLEAGN